MMNTHSPASRAPQPGRAQEAAGATSECPVFFALLLAVWTAYIVFLHPIILTFDEAPRLIAGSICRFTVFALPVLLWTTRVLHRDIPSFFRLERPLAGIGWGIGIGGFLLIFALLRAEFVMPSGIKPVWASGFTLLNAVAIAPFCEELLFRGYFLQRLAGHFPFWAANLLSATAFVIIHFPGWLLIEQTAILPFRFMTILDILLLGLISGWLLRRSGTIWACITLHAINNLLSLSLFS